MSDRWKLRRGLRKDIDLDLYEPGYITDEDRISVGGPGGPIDIPSKKDIDNLKNNKIGLYIGPTIPEVSNRDPNTLYFKVTDTVSTGGDIDNVKVSPTMGIKEV